MKKSGLLNNKDLAAYALKLKAMSDDELLKEITENIEEASWRIYHSLYDQLCDAGYNEAHARGKNWIYQSAYNKIAYKNGDTISENDIENAKPKETAS